MHRKALLFDIDGTLVDSNDAHVDAWLRAFAGEGFDFSREAVHEQIGKGGDNLLPTLLPDAPPELRERIDQAHGEIYKREYLPQVKPFAGAREILRKAAAAGQKVVLASSASRGELDHYLRLLDAGALLAGTTSKDDVEHSKPCPDIFARALERTGCAPDEAIVIGDTPYDIQAAHRAGLDTVAVLSGGFPEDQLRACRPVAIYADVAQLVERYQDSPLAAPQETIAAS